jgi:hypothetical protein
MLRWQREYRACAYEWHRRQVKLQRLRRHRRHGR